MSRKQRFKTVIEAPEGHTLVNGVWRNSSAPLKTVEEAQAWLHEEIRRNQQERRRYIVSVVTNCADCGTECGVAHKHGHEYYCGGCSNAIEKASFYGF